VDYPRYDPQSALTPLNPSELEGLDLLLQKLPADGAMSLDGVDGFLTALLSGAPEILSSWPTADWLPWVWGGDGPLGNAEATPFASKRQRKDTVVLLLRHLRHIAAQLHGDAAGWEPVFDLAEQGADEWADARGWCAGFLQAVDLQPDAWADAFAAVDAAPLLALGGGLEGVDCAIKLDEGDLATVDELSRVVPDVVLALRAQVPRTSG
jgi:uncharacterized protein